MKRWLRYILIIGTALAAATILATGTLAQPAGAMRSSHTADSILAAATTNQRPALEDFRVTRAEFLEAVHATVECIETQGAVVDGYRFSADYPQAGFSVHSSDDSMDLDSIIDACYESHLSAVLAMRALTVKNSVDTEQWVTRVAACLARAGLDVPNSGSARELIQSLDLSDRNTDTRFMDCRSEVEHITKIRR